MMQNPADNQATRTRRTRQRGTSLVEVLVVLVILVLGIFSIARLFPGGFFTIRSAENNTFADRLAQAQLETLKQNSAFLLDAVYVYNTDGTLNSNVNLADLKDDYPSAPQTPDAAYNDINKARYIKGESFTVPAIGTNGVPAHVLNYGPVHIPPSAVSGVPYPYVPGPSNPAQFAAAGFGLFSAPWTAQAGSSQLSPADLSQRVDPTGDVLQAGQPSFLVDYANGQIAVPPAPYAQNFILAYKAPTSNGFATFTTTFTVAANNATSSPYTGGWFAPTGGSNAFLTNVLTAADTPNNATLPSSGVTYVTGSVVLTRPLTFVSADPASSPQTYPNLVNQADPYTYELAAGTNVKLNGSGGDEYMGVLVLNPRLSGQRVSADYLTVDWHIIHEDTDVPAITNTFGGGTSVTNAPIRLTLNHLRRLGDVLPDQTVYPGLFAPPPGGAAPVNPFDIVLVDTDTGQMQGLAATSVGPTGAVSDSDNDATAPAAGQFAVSYQNGRVTLPAQTVAGVSLTQAWASVPHRHLRVFYAGDYGWAVALQKNPSLYTQFTGTGTVPGLAQYVADPANPQHLIFPVSDFGQSVEVDQIGYTDTSGNAQQVSTASGAIKTDFAGTDYVDLSPFLGNVDTKKPITIGTVRGASARAVVIWKERDQFKSRSIGTILNRS